MLSRKSTASYQHYPLESAKDTITDNGNTYFGDGVPTVNVWTKNLFGTTDPVSLSK